jgi:hypothetical protein
MKVITTADARVGNFFVPKGLNEVPNWVYAQLESAGMIKKEVRKVEEIKEVKQTKKGKSK